MENNKEEIGKFVLSIKLFRYNGKLTPEFESLDINMSREVLIVQLKTFLGIIEDAYRQDFKGNVTSISGNPG